MREATVYSALLMSAQGFVPALAQQLTGKATNHPKLLLGTKAPSQHQQRRLVCFHQTHCNDLA